MNRLMCRFEATCTMKNKKKKKKIASPFLDTLCPRNKIIVNFLGIQLINFRL